MKRITTYVLIILNLITFISTTSGCSRRTDIVEPYQEESEAREPDPPPPPPPPPPSGNLRGAAYTSEDSEFNSLEDIARNVLEGDYGPTLQNLLSDEISTCLNQMAAEQVIFINHVEDRSYIRINEDKKGGIMFDSGYIADGIISGEFGSEAKEVLTLMMGKHMKNNQDLIKKQ